jgi:17beta-estradiol 17-dehydrogenase / very-long-chain 3-oxoacyl-CoA reductase
MSFTLALFLKWSERLFMLYLFITLLKLLRWAKYHVFRSFSTDFQERYGKGSWAVVTGASDGIGRGYCQMLASKGMNIVLISRTMEKLVKVAEELKQTYKVETLIIQRDFGKSLNPDFFPGIFSEIGPRDVSILINNVGVAFAAPMKKLHFSRFFLGCVVNCLPQIAFTRYFAPLLDKRPSRSAIVNVASAFHYGPGARYMGPYAGSKTFNLWLSEANSKEIGSENIDWQCLMPGFVYSNMTKKLSRSPLMGWIHAKDCAREALMDLGRKRRTHGHLKHVVWIEAMKFLGQSPVVQLLKNAIMKLLSMRSKRKRTKKPENAPSKAPRAPTPSSAEEISLKKDK